MFEWWTDLPWWLRYGTAAALLLVSTLLFFAGIFWPWGLGGGHHPSDLQRAVVLGEKRLPLLTPSCVVAPDAAR